MFFEKTIPSAARELTYSSVKHVFDFFTLKYAHINFSQKILTLYSPSLILVLARLFRSQPSQHLIR